MVKARKTPEGLSLAMSCGLMFRERIGGEPKVIRLSDTFAGLRKSSKRPDIY